MSALAPALRDAAPPADPRTIEFDVRTDEMLVNMGPQHPSTHGVLRLLLRTDGEIVRECTPHIGYLHRCAEKIGENLTPAQFVPYCDRMDYLSAMNMDLGWSCAVEKLLKLDVPERGRHLRVAIAELGRIASHLIAMGTYGLDLGTFSPFLYAFREREMILDLFEQACGARLTYSYLTPGGATNDLPERIPVPPGLAQVTGRPAGEEMSWCDATRLFLDWFEPRIAEYHTLLTRNGIFIKRTAGLGVLSEATAVDHACTGPVLRGSGVDHDLRRDGEPVYTRHYDGYDFDVIAGPFADAPPEAVPGDNWTRFLVRMLEVVQSVRLVRQALDRYEATGGDYRTPHRWNVKLPKDECYLETECPRGQMGFYLRGDGTPIPVRARAKSSSFCNLWVVGPLSVGCFIADVPSILGSLDVVMGEIDR